MIVSVAPAKIVSHKDVETPRSIHQLTFLVHQLAILRDCPNLGCFIVRRNGGRQVGAVRTVPGQAIVVRVCKEEVVVSVCIGRLADNPRRVKSPLAVVEAVDVGVVFVTLEVTPIRLPLSGRRTIPVDVAVAAS